MDLRTIRCWAIYNPKRRRIVSGFRTKKTLKEQYPLGIPLGCVIVQLTGNYVPLRSFSKRNA